MLKNQDYYLELAQLVEILKVEGNWTERGSISIYNKSPELIANFSNLFKDINLKYSINYLIKIKLPGHNGASNKWQLLEDKN